MGQPAAVAGLQKGDIILKIDGVDIVQNNYDEAFKQVGELITEKTSIFTVNRNGEIIEVSVKPIYSDETDNKGYKIGIYFGYTYEPMAVGTAISYSAKKAGEMITLIARAFKNLIFKGEGVEDVGGPVSIVKVINDATKEGFISVLSIFCCIGRLT